MLILRFGGKSVSETVLDIVVEPEVWHEVIPWWRGWWCLCGIIPCSEFLLSIGSVQEAVLDFVVLAEIWDEVVSWWTGWLCKTSSHRMIVLILSNSNINLGTLDIIVLSEVGDKVVHWVAWFCGSLPLSELTFGDGCVLQCFLNVMVLAEIWNEIILRMLWISSISC
jgi:hypothetical protein